MIQQIKPHQIISRIEQLINEQSQKDYKPGWVSYKLKELCGKKAKHLIAYDWQGHDCYIAYVGYKVANGEWPLKEAQENLEALYESHMANEEYFN